MVVGKYYTFKLTEGEQKVTPKEWISHPNYTRAKGNPDNDFAIIKLASPVNFNDQVSPICLPSSTNYDNVVATVTGWGTLFDGGPQSPQPHIPTEGVL